MDVNDPFWISEQVVESVRARKLGALVKYVRKARQLTQQALAQQVNVSTSTLSRFESGTVKNPDIQLSKALAEKLGIPPHLVGVALGLTRAVSPNVRSQCTQPEEDPIHRRSFLTLAGLTVPALVGNLNNVLAGVAPGVDAAPGELARRFATARALYDRGRNDSVLRGLPYLLRLADQELESGTGDAMRRYCRVNDLATDLLGKVGLINEARLTAQNSVRVSRRSGSPLTMAAADRGLSIVLRREGNPATANLVSLRAANLVEQTGLVNAEQATSYVQVMCTHSYSAALNDDRDGASVAIAEAERAAAYLRGRVPDGLSARALAKARMYQVSVHWALDDAGAAVRAGRWMDLRALSTPERRARHFTDMARAWWSWRKPEPTATALLNALSHAPAEVIDRARIRAIADDLVGRNRHLSVVSQLADRITASRGGPT
ncbi:MAG TPA: helix-turn-helix transcriptional regulator [Pseudonocardiaceae bacterium]|nr:helix-turn-helix transcriptional regulator [Pseudonocardiaceae bacterium]